MKKKLMWLMALAVMVVSVFALVACGSSKAGTYKFYSLKVEQGGVSVELKAGEKFMGFMTLSEDVMVVELKEDGTVTVSSSMGGSAEVETGTWKENEEDSGKIDITIGGETETFECNGKELRMVQDGIEFTLKK